jgi:DNA-binding PadR family transcriptional regulator
MLTKNDLLVLGFLLERPMHGYEINQALKEENVESWFEISTAAIYYSLNKLRRLGMIAVAQTRGSSGEKTIYHVTEHGREQFFTSMRDQIDSQQPIRTDYDLGIFMLNRLPQDQAQQLLKRRIAFLNAWRTDLEMQLEATEAHPLKQAIVHHTIALANLDIEWLTKITEQIAERETCEAPFWGLMTLRGDLQDYHLPDLIKLIASGKHSGTLVISYETETRSLTFVDGHPYCAASQVSGKSITDGDQVQHDIYELFRWQQGEYAFDQRNCPQNGCIMLNTTAFNLILDGARRLDAWDIIQRIVPSSDVLFEPLDAAERREHLTLQKKEVHILKTVDGLKDVTTLARDTHLTEFETSKILYGLYAVDLIQPANPDKSRLRRVFREFAELMCQGALPYRTTPEEATLCENEVNHRCEDLPVRINNGHIEDRTDASLQVDDLAAIYRTFLQTQHQVLGERLGQEVADELRHHVLNRINPTLRETLKTYSLL